MTVMGVNDFGGAFIAASKMAAPYVGSRHERPMCGYNYNAILKAATNAGFCRPTPDLVESIGEYACKLTTVRRRRRILVEAELRFFGPQLVESAILERFQRPGVIESLLHRAFELLAEQTVAMVFSLQPAKPR